MQTNQVFLKATSCFVIMHELLAARYALRLETGGQKKRFCVPALRDKELLPVLPYHCCTRAGLSSWRGGLCTQPFIWTRGQQLIFEGEIWAQGLLGGLSICVMQNGHKKRCGGTFKTFLTATDSLELHEDKLKVPLSHREPRRLGVFSHTLSKLHNHRDSSNIGLDVFLSHFSCKGEFYPYIEMFPK